MLETRLWNGSITSARPDGDQIEQGLAAIRGTKRGSRDIRCSQAEVSMVAVVEVGFG